MYRLIKWFLNLPHKHSWKYFEHPHEYKRTCRRCRKQEMLVMFTVDNHLIINWVPVEEVDPTTEEQIKK